MINIELCGNRKVYDGMLMSLLSIIKNTNEELNVYVLTMDLHELDERFVPITDEQIETLNKVVKTKNELSKVQKIDITKKFKSEMLHGKNMKTHYTPYIFVRLFSDVIEELPDKILYIDTDIICYKDIKELFDIDISQYELAVATDCIGRKAINKKYMNSGVILMNLKRIRKTESFEKAREMCNNKWMMMPDQSAIYRCCKEKLYLPDKYNEQKARKEDTVIRHFSMTIRWLPIFHLVNIKPWNVEKVHEKYHIFDYEDIIEQYNDIQSGKEPEELLKKYKIAEKV